MSVYLYVCYSVLDNKLSTGMDSCYKQAILLRRLGMVWNFLFLFPHLLILINHSKFLFLKINRNSNRKFPF